jgi:2-amino-4-hydroxy-6-hydroxymethyldihydropteridine diphosphokinase
MPDSVTAYVALGSNLGDRRASLDQAIALLRLQPGVVVQAVSSYHETAPVGGPPGQGSYLNAAAQVQTTLEASKLLHVLLGIEKQLGRVRAERYGPRTLDLDLLLYGTQILHVQAADGELIVPHPHMHERLFVLAPLVEIAPLAVHPQLQSTAKGLLERCLQNQQPRPAARELTGLNAVVTGATKGIGRAIARTLAEAGSNVIVHGRDRGTAEAAAEECRAQQVQTHILLADLREPDAGEKLAERAWHCFPRIDIWINNAGADLLTGEAGRWPFEKKLHELWLVDVQATMLLARAAGLRMRRQGGGVILTMGWDQAATGMEGDSGQLFAASKGAIMAFTKSLALTLAPEVRVNCLAPGWIRTAWGEQASQSWQERVLRETPLARWGTPNDVAQAARWLVSPAARFITGQIVRVNGGAVRS